MMDSNEFVEQNHVGIPYITPKNVCDAYYDFVIILVVKGNLKHRIEKLGRISADSSDESISDTDEFFVSISETVEVLSSPSPPSSPSSSSPQN